jgi:putative DNA primase/helicase
MAIVVPNTDDIKAAFAPDPRLREAILAEAASDPLGAYTKAGYNGNLRQSGHNLIAPCPFHADSDPSLTIGLSDQHRGKWKCFGACGTPQDDIIGFFRRLHPNIDYHEALLQLAERMGLRGEAVGIRPQTVAVKTTPASVPHPDPLQESVALECHRRLMASQKALSSLMERKGLPLWAIQRARIGLSHNHWRQARYTIPIPYLDGRDGYCDLRGYRPGGEAKMLPWAKGRGSATIYPWPWVSGSSWLVWCEGEIDCLNLIGRGIPALTATCGVDGAIGEGLLFPDLTGREIFVMGDADAAGAKLNLNLPERLRNAGAAAVTRLLWPDSLPNGEPTPEKCDPSDLLTRCCLTDEDLWGWLGL